MAVQLSKPLRRRTKPPSTTHNDGDRPSNSTSGARRPTLKALIIASAGNNTNGQTLLTPHRDAQDWREVLMTLYGYGDHDITMMLDDEETLSNSERSHLVPSKNNIVAQMRKLEAGAQPGDRFMFYYNGHGIQIDTQNKDEEDGFDEAIVPYTLDGKVDHILDDELRRLLVEFLPAGAALTAIFDCCRSGTMLDLEHYACNNVPFPWVNRGPRDLGGPLHAYLKRATALRPSLLQKLENGPTPQGTGAVTSTEPGHPSGVILVKVRACTLVVSPPRHRRNRMPRRASSTPVHGNGVWVQLPCEEPESFLQCDGFNCWREEGGEKTKPDVISISACQDGEQTWESPSGVTFTQALIELLKSDPRMPIRQLVQRVGLTIYEKTTQKLHDHCAKKLEKLWAAGPYLEKEMRAHWQYELFNSPRPQIGSTYFLRADERFCA